MRPNDNKSNSKPSTERTTARDLGPKGFDTQFGAGLVDAYEAVRSLAPSVATTTGTKVIPAATPQ